MLAMVIHQMWVVWRQAHLEKAILIRKLVVDEDW
jgi:hypothetical protein